MPAILRLQFHALRAIGLLLVTLVLLCSQQAGGGPAASGGEDKAALEWVADLKSPVPGTRNRATSALARLEPMPPEVVVGVAALLQEKDWTVRAHALMVLGNMGPDASIVLPSILDTLNNDEHKQVRHSAAGLLPKVPARTYQERRALVDLIGTPGRDNYYLRSQASRGLIAVAAQAGDVSSDLAQLAVNEDRSIADTALNTLAKFPAETAVPALIPLLTDHEASVRQGAARILGGFGPRASPAVPTLIALLNEYPHYLMAVHTLARIGPGAKEAVPALLAFYERPDPSRELRLAVTGALGAIGTDASEVLPLFRRELKGQELSEATGRYRNALALAIINMSGSDDPAIEAYVKRLIRAQSSWNPMKRVEAVKSLAELGPAATPALDPLRESLRKDNEPKIRSLAAEALGGIGAAARPALPDLRKAAAEDDPYVQKRASQAIAEIEASELAVPAQATPKKAAADDENLVLRQELEDDITSLSASGSRRAAAALRLLERAPASLPIMHGALLAPDTDVRVRSRLLVLLGDLGDEHSVPVILELVRNWPQEQGLRIDALRALGIIPLTPASLAFAQQVLKDAGELQRVKRQALIFLALQREASGATWVRRYRDDEDQQMRVSAYYLAASLGDSSVLEPITAVLNDPAGLSGRYAMLLALAELVDLEEFRKRAGAPRGADQDYDSAVRLLKIRGLLGKERVALARKMIESHFPNERRTGMTVILAEEAMAEFSPMLAQWWRVPAHTRATVAAGLYRGGYHLVEKDRSIVIERLSR